MERVGCEEDAAEGSQLTRIDAARRRVYFQIVSPRTREFLYITLSSEAPFDGPYASSQMKTSSLPNYGASRQSQGGFRTPSLPRRLGVKMGTRAIYSSLPQKDTALTDDTESLSLKSDTESSMQSLSARSAESPMPEAYVLSA